MIAKSIIAAAKELGLFHVSVVIHLQETNSEEDLKLVSWYHPNQMASNAPGWPDWRLRNPVFLFT